MPDPVDAQPHARLKATLRANALERRAIWKENSGFALNPL
jgi:hypothetical protein